MAVLLIDPNGMCKNINNALNCYSYNILEDKSFLLTGIVLDFNVATNLSLLIHLFLKGSPLFNSICLIFLMSSESYMGYREN